MSKTDDAIRKTIAEMKEQKAAEKAYKARAAYPETQTMMQTEEKPSDRSKGVDKGELGRKWGK